MLLRSRMNCSRNVPIRLLEISIERSLKLGKPSTCRPSPHIRNWFPIIKDPETLIAIPSWPWERHWSFSTTCTSLSRGQSPANVLRILERVENISFEPTECFPEKLEKYKDHIKSTPCNSYSNFFKKKNSNFFSSGFTLPSSLKQHDIRDISLVKSFRNL